MTLSRERKSAAERKAEIVEAALFLAAAVGPQKASAEAIAARIGLTQPAIFRHFPRMEDLWQAVIQWLEEQLTTRWREATAAAAPEACVEAVVGAHLHFVSQFPAMPLVLLSPELRRNCEAIGMGAERLMAGFHQALAEAVRIGQRAAVVTEDIAPAEAAQMLLALVQGTALRWAVGGNRFDLAAEGARLTAMAMRGILA